MHESLEEVGELKTIEAWHSKADVLVAGLSRLMTQSWLGSGLNESSHCWVGYKIERVE